MEFDHTKESFCEAIGITHEQLDEMTDKLNAAIDLPSTSKSETVENIVKVSMDNPELALAVMFLHSQRSPLEGLLGGRGPCDNPKCKGCHPENFDKDGNYIGPEVPKE